MAGFLDGLNLPDHDSRPVRQKWDLKTRVDERAAADKKDDAALEKWRRKVYARDKHVCRHCGCKVERTITLQENQAQAHHVTGRADAAVRYELRNGLTLCYRCHRRVTGMVNVKLIVVGTKWFRLNGTKYINASAPVRFRKAA